MRRAARVAHGVGGAHARAAHAQAVDHRFDRVFFLFVERRRVIEIGDDAVDSRPDESVGDQFADDFAQGVLALDGLLALARLVQPVALVDELVRLVAD